MKKIKILLIGLSPNMGGIETYIINLYRNIDKKKFEISFLIFKGEKVCFYDELKQDGAIFFEIEKRTKNYFRFISDLKKVFKENEFDFIHFNLVDFSCFERILIAEKYSNAKIIIHSHIANNIAMKKKTNFLSKIGEYFIKKYEENYIKVACSKLAGDYMFKDFKNKDYLIFNNAIDVSKFKFDTKIREEKRKELGINKNTLVIGNIGRFVEQKNHELLIEIFYRLDKVIPNLELVLVGEGPLKADIEVKVKKYNLQNKVKFLGLRNDVNELLQVIDIFMMFSKYEGLPFVLIEAQAAGLPCYLSNTISEEVKLLDNTVFFDINNIDKLFNNVLINLNDNKKIDRAEQSKVVLKSKYNIELEIKNVEKLYLDNIKGEKYG